MNKIIIADAITGLKQIESGTVDTCVTSPPYYGLRDYQTGTWQGGNPECDHAIPIAEHDPKRGDNDGSSSHTVRFNRTECYKCGAKRVDMQIGLEETPEQYITRLVDVFHEVKRVLRDDGTLWVNIGDSYVSGRVTNTVDELHRLLEQCFIFGVDTLPIAISSEGVDISKFDKPLKVFELASFFSVQRELAEDGDDNFTEVFDFFATPGYGRSCVPDTCLARNTTATDFIGNKVYGGNIVISDLNTDCQPKLVVSAAGMTRPCEDNYMTFAVKKTSKPRTKICINWHSDWNTFFQTTVGKSRPNVDVVNEPIPFAYGFLPFSCNMRDFRVTKASEEQVTFTSVGGGIEYTVGGVRHLYFLLSDGSVVPYTTLYHKAEQKASKNKPKNQLLIPFRLATALQEDGWICRQTIIWAKPNPMPESVKDRCTKSHEYIFLLSKNSKYYYDNDAIKEKANDKYAGRYNSPFNTGEKESSGEGRPDNASNTAGMKEYTGFKNKRDVWTVSTHPYKGAHFATFPPELIRPCIKAGSRQNGIVLDPFAGSGTTAQVSVEEGRQYIAIELNEAYKALIQERVDKVSILKEAES